MLYREVVRAQAAYEYRVVDSAVTKLRSAVHHLVERHVGQILKDADTAVIEKGLSKHLSAFLRDIRCEDTALVVAVYPDENDRSNLVIDVQGVLSKWQWGMLLGAEDNWGACINILGFMRKARWCEVQRSC